MCTSSKAKVSTGGVEIPPAAPCRINGRPVLQPIPTLERRSSLKKLSNKSPPSPPPLPPPTLSPKSRSPRLPAVKRGSNSSNTLMNSSSDKVSLSIPRTNNSNNYNSKTATLDRKKSKSFKESIISTVGNNVGFVLSSSSSSIEASLSYSSSLIMESPGSIAAVRREQMALQHAQRKMKIAHYGRSKSAKFESKVVPIDTSSITSTAKPEEEDQRRCSFITSNSDPIYIAYHDEEWGAPVHDDKMLFELLVLSGAQVGSDWTSILRKRQDFRNAFSGFDAETVANMTEKQMMSISTEYGIDMSRVRGVVDNSNRILEIEKEFGSFDKYVWAFVNNKPISTQYKFGHKVPVKTSKSETISKDMVRRGFRFAGPTVVHSFMQAAGLTNDHLISCHRHLPCTLMAARRSTRN
ncbi:hypothetical protein K2173_001259 [Erythroxylum novogranatense]|uniref:DNA-3-methyladenine glycosylase I n=1 Tax=Erythroxylum novogranatense TaxID=1862640 RepID=A0AAV8T3R9_9ROSI|nr:hypothetical protein K2173_001259 [Erythroxylum novogranatense]